MSTFFVQQILNLLSCCLPIAVVNTSVVEDLSFVDPGETLPLALVDVTGTGVFGGCGSTGDYFGFFEGFGISPVISGTCGGGSS